MATRTEEEKGLEKLISFEFYERFASVTREYFNTDTSALLHSIKLRVRKGGLKKKDCFTNVLITNFRLILLCFVTAGKRDLRDSSAGTLPDTKCPTF